MALQPCPPDDCMEFYSVKKSWKDEGAHPNWKSFVWKAPTTLQSVILKCMSEIVM